VPKAKPLASEKITVSNLAFSVTENDVKELFTQIGPLKHCSLNYNEKGKSKGIANVTFVRPGDGTKAVKEYNNRTFDGRPMKIELLVNPSALPVVTAANRLGAPVNKGRDAVAKRGRGAGRGRGGKRGGPSRKPATAADLDAELDGYMNDQVSFVY
jgi:THO complex subunit 4